MKIDRRELKAFLDKKVSQYNRPEFIEHDPISIPHLFSQKEDIELIALLVATIAWGQRGTIIKNSLRLTEMMEHAPHQFISSFEEPDLNRFDTFIHRTFQPYDVKYFLRRLQFILKEYGSLEPAFKGADGASAIQHFRKIMVSVPHETRVEKHLPDIARGAAAKRLNMFLRWMVRKDGCGVDFGIWNQLNPSQLYLPLDVHTASVSRKLGLLSRKANDWRAVDEVTANLRKLDAADPVKYDFALFSLGANEQF